MNSSSQFLKLSLIASLVLMAAGCGGRGLVASQEALAAAPPTIAFSANPTTVAPGQPVTLTWSTTDTTTATLDGAAIAKSGTMTKSPATTTTYVLAATGPGGNSTANVTVTVSTASAPPGITFTANPANITAGQSSTLTWATTNATSVSIDSGVTTTATPLSGNATVSPSATRTYTLTATGPGGTATASATVTVSTGPMPPTIQFTASPANITMGQSSTLTWATNNATSVSFDGGVTTSTPPPLSGTATVSPTTTHTYTLTATGPGGTVTATATVTVAASTGQGIKSVNHVIYMLQENRSFDNYFGKLGAYRAANGYGAATDIDGLPDNASNPSEDRKVTIPAFHIQTMCIENVSPDWVESHAAYNLSKPGSDVFTGDGFVHNGQGMAQFAGRIIETTNTASSVTVSPRSPNRIYPAAINYYLFSSRNGPVLAQVTVNINAPGSAPSNSFFADPDTIATGSSSTLKWNIPNATSVTIDNGVGTFTGSSGSAQVSPTSSTTYGLSATVGTNTVTASTSVNVSSSPGLTFTASTKSIVAGESVTLQWNIPGATLALVSKWYDQPGRRAMGYYDETDLPYYYFMASNFATSDRWFSPISSNSEPNRIYALAATSHGHAHDPGSFNSNNVKNIFQLLEEAGISWKVYYQPIPSGVIHTRMDRFQPFRTDHADKIVPATQYFDDLKNGTLPQVAYIEELSGKDEHPGGTLTGNIHSGNHIQQGALFMSTYINALMGSQYWKDSVFFMTFDEMGGLYDHVSPQSAVHPDGIAPMDLEQKDIDWIVPQGDFNRTGFRVPLIVVSPFTKKSYVSHTVADFTAMLKFIETRFSLPSLTARDAAQMDMTEFFNFDAPPWLTPPTPPVQPVNKGCDYTNLK